MNQKNRHELLRKLNSLVDIVDICNLLFDEIEKIYPFTYMVIRLVDNKTIYNVKARFQEALRHLEYNMDNTTERLTVNDSPIMTTCIHNGKSLILENDTIDPNFAKRSQYLSGQNRTVIIPIKSFNGDVIGILQVIDTDCSRTIHRAIPRLEELIGYFYSYFFVYLKPYRESISENLDHFRKVSQAFIKINQLITTDKVFHKLLSEILAIFGFDLIYFLLRVDDKLKIIEGITSDKEFDHILDGLMNHFNAPGNEILIGNVSAADMVCSYVYKTNIPIYIKDTLPISHLTMSEKDQIAINIVNRPLRSVLHIPIRDGEDAYGVLELFSFDENIIDINNDDMETLINLCSLIPTAIRNSELYTEIGKKNLYIEEQNRKIFQQLKLAKEIQRNIIPKHPPVYEDLKIATIYTPMEDLGGDFFDFIVTENTDYAGVFLSDVSGHGIPAALVTSMVKSLISNLDDLVYSPHEFLNELNEKITGFTIGNFLTAIYALINIKSRKMLFARGAHCYPFIIRKGEVIEIRQGKGKMLGFFNNIDFELVEVQLHKGDKVLLYTDGFTEAFNSEKNEDFDIHLPGILAKNSHKDINGFINSLYSELIQFNGSENFEDDVCLIGLEML